MKKAFTLLEVIVSAIILAVGIVGLVALATYSRTITSRERNQLIAAEYANSILENLVFSENFTSAALTIGTHQVTIPATGSFWTNFNPTVSYSVAGYAIDPAQPTNTSNAKEIVANVTWQQPFWRQKLTRSITLTTLKTQ